MRKIFTSRPKRSGLLAGSALLMGAALGAHFWLSSASPTEYEQAQLDMLDRARNMTQAEIEALPKQDRPDLALLQNLTMTKDPGLGYVPEGAGLAAFRLMQKHLDEYQAKAISGVSWTERGPNDIGGRTRALMWDPNTPNKVWAGGVGGGLWYNTNVSNASVVWQSVNDFWANIAITTITYDPSNTQTFYVGTGEGFFGSSEIQGAGIWKSTNGGTSWAQLSSTDNSNFLRVQKVAVTSSGTVLAATRTGLYRSTNGGSSWTTIKTGRFADIEVASNGDVYASEGIFSTGVAIAFCFWQIHIDEKWCLNLEREKEANGRVTS